MDTNELRLSPQALQTLLVRRAVREFAPRTRPKGFACGFQVSCPRFFFGGENPDYSMIAANLNSRPPRVSHPTLVARHASCPVMNRVNVGVGSVAVKINDPQIFEPVVELVPVNVVDKPLWPFAVHVQPRNAMRQNLAAEQRNSPVPVGARPSGAVSSPWANAVKKISSLWLVAKFISHQRKCLSVAFAETLCASQECSDMVIHRSPRR